jgi:hypothetical protein
VNLYPAAWVAPLGELGLGLGRQVEGELPVCEALPQVPELDLHDLGDLLLAEGVEGDDLVDAVQELGPEGPPQRLHELVLEAVLVPAL